MFVLWGKEKWKSDKFVMKNVIEVSCGAGILIFRNEEEEEDGNSKIEKPDKSDMEKVKMRFMH